MGYVAMLNKAYEKYSKLELINSNFEHFNDSSDPHTHDNNKKLLEEDDKSRRGSLTKGRKSNDNHNQKSKKYKNSANYGHKRYSEEENAILIKFLDNNPDFYKNKSMKIRELTKIMKGRTFDSIKYQIARLQQGLIVPRREKRLFSLTEDKLIIDEAIRNIKHCKSLREVGVRNSPEFCKSFGRAPWSVSERWENVVKCWLLQFYNKNLNQEIRPMLVDLIHKNFDSTLEIDWEFIANHEEFSGYTYYSWLKKIVCCSYG